MNINYDELKKQALVRALGLEKYVYIRENYNKCNVSENEEFQKTFNAFYRVRRDEKWRKKFYKYFEKVKNNPNIEFTTIVKDLLLETGNIEASFASKLLSTINPNMPIWDQYVLKNLNLRVKGKTKGERLVSTFEVYHCIMLKENKLLKDKNINEEIIKFKAEFKEYKISNIKVLDYLLWNNRDDEESNI